jgi:hypothetical protein
MNRDLNNAALQQMIAVIESGSLNTLDMLRLRQAAYLHSIVAAMLNEQVEHLPETAEIHH